MKKAVALASASALGIAAAAGGAAGAASADTPPPACATFQDEIDSAGVSLNNLFTTCTPQFGLGKVEFTISSDVPFPADFLPLDDLGVTTGSELDMAALNTYIDSGSNPLTSPFQIINSPASTPTTQTYDAIVFAPVTSVTGVTPADVPAAVLASCPIGDPADVAIFRISFGPVFGTFSQQVAGEDWSYRVGGSPLDTFAFIYAPGDSYCYTDINGERTFTTGDQGGAPIQLVALVPPYSFGVGPDPVFDLGVFSRLPKPALAATGSDSSGLVPAALGAAGATAAGLAALLFSLRRRRRARIQ